MDMTFRAQHLDGYAELNSVVLAALIRCHLD